MGFAAALDRHLGALAGRDLAGFLATVADDPDLTVILPNGTLVRGYDAVADLHRVWFDDPDWRMEPEMLRAVETDDLAFALLRVAYHDRDEGGEAYRLDYYLQLVFARRGDAWLMVHDQNTPLPRSEV